VGLTDDRTGGDLSPAVLAFELPGRPVRSYPALLSTEATALAWARAGAPEGALVVADYQASPRGRAGRPWQVRPGEGLGFSLVLRPRLPVEREGWLYAVATCGLADVLGPDAAVAWPDEVRAGPDGGRLAGVGVHVQLGPNGTEWAVVTVLVDEAPLPRTQQLATVVAAVENRYMSQDGVLDDLRARCMTLGREVTARLVPLGPAGPQVSGQAVDVLADGALVLLTARGNRVAVRPQNLGVLEELPSDTSNGSLG